MSVGLSVRSDRPGMHLIYFFLILCLQNYKSHRHYHHHHTNNGLCLLSSQT